ncbi:MAG TPA: preprotein translocase subunit TatA [Segeticoccus sp.]|uniref:preprotein translocase subunit TatA n=1 Tax=Segeticoccus sp. TaxID=2706531 RepID=UPI002D803D71|nr:preprotein translocase subunit TatA [Segeticoccus sp.]HET8599895.1 preprotein translocase subunit TatA [Segeticoccus sp.]
MGFFDINGWEFVILVVLGVIVLGPERLPEYAAKLARLVKQVRSMADAAKSQLRDQMGPDFEDVDWEQFDPRRYDPRRIVREALLSDGDDDAAAGDPASFGQQAGEPRMRRTSPIRHDPSLPTPYDTDAT